MDERITLLSEECSNCGRSAREIERRLKVQLKISK
jgi:hypothetical protein